MLAYQRQTIFHPLALGLVGVSIEYAEIHLGCMGFRFGCGRVFRYQHVGIGNAKSSHWGYKPMRGPKVNGFGFWCYPLNHLKLKNQNFSKVKKRPFSPDMLPYFICLFDFRTLLVILPNLTDFGHDASSYFKDYYNKNARQCIIGEEIMSARPWGPTATGQGSPRVWRALFLLQ